MITRRDNSYKALGSISSRLGYMGSQAKNQLVMDFMILIDTKDVL